MLIKWFRPAGLKPGSFVAVHHRLGTGVMGFWLLLVLAGMGISAGAPIGPAQTPGPPTSDGYSIFQETMVDLTWQEVEKAAKDGAVVLMAMAVIEEHGPHLSCGTDAYLGYLMCKLTRRELESRGVKALIAPPFFWGINQATQVFPGTFTARPETMKALLADIFASLKSMGFRHIFTINAHGDPVNNRALIEAILDAHKVLGLDIRYLFSADEARQMGLTGEPPSWVLLYKMPASKSAGQKYLDIHAGAFETGAMAAFFPGEVKAKLARTLEATRLTAADIGNWAKDARQVTPLGYVGDPARYNTDEAKKFMEDWCRMMAEAIAGLMAKAK